MKQVNENMPEVLIAGAGPTGLMMACQLSLFNIRLRIIDMKESPSSHSGAMLIHARTMEIFQQMGLAEKMLEQGTVVNGLTVYFNGKKSSHLNLKGTGSSLSKFPFMLLLEQSKTEGLLIEFLRQKGIGIEWNTELVHMEQQAQGVEAELILPVGNREKVTAEYLVAADGGKSTIRSLLKIPFEGKTHETALSVMECDTDIISPSDELLFSFSRQATTGFFPLPKRNWRIDAAFQRMFSNSRLSFNAVQEKFNRKTRLNANIRNPEWFSVFHSHGKYALFYRMHRCFLAGDSAHLFTPVGGQGMNTGLQDAHNLAWKMAMVLKGNTSPEILDTYQMERKPVAIRTCRSSDRFFKLAASGGLGYKLFRNFLLAPLLSMFFKLMAVKRISDSVFKRISGIGISYPGNVLNFDGSENILASAPRPGERIPFINYVDIDGKVVSVDSKISSDRFHLLIFEGNNSSKKELQKAVREFRNTVSIHIIPLKQGSGDLYVKFGIKSQGWYLIRPDLYVSCRSDESGAEHLQTCLRLLFKLN